MKHWKEIKESPRYSQMKHSVELRHARACMLLYGCCCLFCGLLVAAALAVGADGAAVGVAIAAIVMILLPFTLFYIYRTVMIFYRIEDYTFTEAVLDRPHSGLLRDTMYFTVEVHTRSGAVKQAETHSIFTTRGLMEPQFDDYVNQKVIIGYDEATENVVVVGLAES